jgi:hypothetical protein
VVTFLSSNLDRVVLGRLLSLGELGLYSIGMTFARVATQVATRLTNTVVFPLLAKYQDQPARLLAFAVRARAAVLWAGGAVCAGFAIFAPVFFDTLYDERYAGAGPISQWLSLYIWAWILTATIDRIPLALGRPRALFNANLAARWPSGWRRWATTWRSCPDSWWAWRCPSWPRSSCSGGHPGRTVGTDAAVQRCHAGRGGLHPSRPWPAWPCWIRCCRPGRWWRCMALLAAAPLGLAAFVVRRMMAERSTSPELLKLAVDVSARRVEMKVLRERGTDVLIARVAAPDGRPVIVKLWNRRGWRGFLRRFSGTNIARREWDALLRLHKAGLGVPEPLACSPLRDPAARHTEVLIEEDLGACPRCDRGVQGHAARRAHGGCGGLRGGGAARHRDHAGPRAD